MTIFTKFRRAVAIAAFLTVLPTLVLQAQMNLPNVPGIWRAAVNFGFNQTQSPTMQGDLGNFTTQFAGNFENAAMPFGDGASSLGMGAVVTYQPAYSPGSALLGFRSNDFTNSDDNGNKVALSVTTFTVGGEYSIGGQYNPVNLFMRLGANMSLITGEVNRMKGSEQITTEIPSEVRYGCEIGGGIRYNIIGTKYCIEASADYANVNLLNKQYSSVYPESSTATHPLNDGRNPYSATDTERSMEFVTYRVGFGIWF